MNNGQAPVAITADAVTTPAGPYAHATTDGRLVAISGQMAIAPASGTIEHPTDVAAQTHQALANFGAILSEAGGTPGDVVKVTVFLTDMAHFGTVNAIYGDWFGDWTPARSCVAVAALPNPDALVEIEGFASV